MKGGIWMKFEEDETKSLAKGFEEAHRKGKLFNVNTWKKNREKSRLQVKKLF